jgi:proton glutamate symport protein
MSTQKTQSPRGASLTELDEQILDSGLWKKILIGMVLGVSFGLLLSPHSGDILSYIVADAAEKTEILAAIGGWIELLGIVFLGLIKMVVIPLITCSIILGIADSGNVGFVRRIGLRIVPYFIATTAIAIIIGLTFVNITKPGLSIDQSFITDTMESSVASSRLPAKTFEDLTVPQRIANMIPTNPAKANVDRDMLQIVIASILVGIALLQMPNSTVTPITDLCRSVQVLTMHIIGWAMKIAPYAVFGLLGKITIELGFDALVAVAFYAGTVIAALLTMMVVYLLIIKFIVGGSIREFLSNIREVQIIAFSTSSSAATMPITIKACEEKLKLRPEITRFIIPLGATINMDGTALYQAVAAVFLAQAFGVDLTTTETVLLVLTTIGASIGTPATPGVGIVVLATILTSIGVPAEGIALIIGVDRLLDMCRTTINVTGDATAAAVMNKWVK